jgi:hypothetical protein
VPAAVAWIVFSRAIIGRACPYVAMNRLWTTNTILWIRTVVRRFLTKPVGALAAAEMRHQSRTSVQRSPITSSVLTDSLRVDADRNVNTAMYE